MGVAYWQGRVSPVFDEARHLVVITITGGREIGRDRLLLQTRNLWDRVRFLTAGSPEASAVPPSGDAASKGLPPPGGSGLSAPRFFAGGGGGRRGCGRRGGGRGGPRSAGDAACGRTPEAVSLEEEAERLRQRLAEIEARLGKRDPRFRR